MSDISNKIELLLEKIEDDEDFRVKICDGIITRMKSLETNDALSAVFMREVESDTDGFNITRIANQYAGISLYDDVNVSRRELINKIFIAVCGEKFSDIITEPDKHVKTGGKFGLDEIDRECADLSEAMIEWANDVIMSLCGWTLSTLKRMAKETPEAA